MIERRQPSLLIDGSILITGEVDRTTGFERGMPPAHQAWDGHEWHHDAEVIDDQALVVNVRGRASFGATVATTAATPAGLPFIAVSINLQRILHYPNLP